MAHLTVGPRDNPVERATEEITAEIDEAYTVHVATITANGLDLERFHILTST